MSLETFVKWHERRSYQRRLPAAARSAPEELCLYRFLDRAEGARCKRHAAAKVAAASR